MIRPAPRAAALVLAAAWLLPACSRSPLPAASARLYAQAAQPTQTDATPGRVGPSTQVAPDSIYDEADRELGPRAPVVWPAPEPLTAAPAATPGPATASPATPTVAPDAARRARPGRPRGALVSPGGRKAYSPSRTASAPQIDGVLDEAIWRVAPEDSRFVNPRSEPHGIEARQPTSFQMAYDADNLYIAIRCWDPDPGEHDDAAALDEPRIATVAESVTIMLDGRGARHHARTFTVAKSGDRADAQVGDDGRRVDYEWRGTWQSAVVAKESIWTAELAIPWRTIDALPGDDARALGLEVQRQVPSTGGMVSVWSLAPPSYGAAPPPSFYGDLVGVSGIADAPVLYLRPYAAVGARLPPDRSTVGRLPLSRLRNFASDSDELYLYAGLEGRIRPIEPVRIDFAVNPDFSQVSPDAVIANLDRFEPAFPEVRPFFAEDRTRFEMGTEGAELFYSRRIGLKPKGASRFEEVPVLYAVKAHAEHEGTYLAAMNVGLSTPRPAISLDDRDTVVRLQHDFGASRRVGTIFMHRAGDGNRHMATGVDGAYSMLDQHLMLTGFFARSQTDGRDSGMVGHTAARWASREVRMGVSYLDVGEDFDPQLGFFPLTGIRSGRLNLGFTPQIRNDYVGVLVLDATIDRTRDREERLVYNRAVLGASAMLLDAATVSVRLRPSVEGVTDGFKIAGGRILVQPGTYDQLGLDFEVRSPPRQTIELGAGYSEGDLWDGYMRSPWLEASAHRGPFTGTGTYKLLLVQAGGEDVTGHLIGARALYAFTPRLRTSLDVQMNSFDPRAAVHLVGTYGFGDLSALTLVVAQSADTVELFSDDPDRRAILSFAYGLSPF